MLKILQARLQQYMNHELPDGQAGFRKGRRARDQITNIHWIIEKAREFHLLLLYWLCQPLTVWLTANCGKFLKTWEYQTCLLRNLYADQEVTHRTGHGTADWFQIGKGVHQGCILSPCLFNLYAEYIMRNLYAGQKAIVRTGHGTTDWLKIGKGVWQGCILSPCLFKLYAE